MLHLNRIVGNSSGGEIAEKLHRLSHDGRLEEIRLSAADTARKRLRVTTDKGTDCAIALNRDANLENGSVLLLEDERAIVVRMLETKWLRIAPTDTAAALELGYFAGNLHWRVRFDGALLEIALEGPVENYLNRLARHIESGRARRVDDA
ncbi:MAG: urease accessory protein UreE [Alphaproteobacteria bacterium]